MGAAITTKSASLYADFASNVAVRFNFFSARYFSIYSSWIGDFFWLINSTFSGIIETPSLGRYTINIGDRQRGRVHGNSVIDVTCDSSIIGQAMKEITGKSEEIINPYYVENTAENYNKKTKEILENGTSILKEFYDIV